MPDSCVFDSNFTIIKRDLIKLDLSLLPFLFIDIQNDKDGYNLISV